jgi:hypothetical protein
MCVFYNVRHGKERREIEGGDSSRSGEERSEVKRDGGEAERRRDHDRIITRMVRLFVLGGA